MKWKAICIALMMVALAASIARAEVPSEYIPILQQVYKDRLEGATNLEAEAAALQKNLLVFDDSIPPKNRYTVRLQREKDIKAKQVEAQTIRKSVTDPPIEPPIIDFSAVGAVGNLRLDGKPSILRISGREVVVEYSYISEEIIPSSGDERFLTRAPTRMVPRTRDFRIVFLKEPTGRRGESITVPRVVKVVASGEIPTVAEVDWDHAVTFWNEYLKSIGVIK